MSAEVTSPLRDIIKRAAERQVEGPAGKMKQRFVDASDEIVAVCDCSGSMSDLIGSQNMTKWDHLKIALKDVLLLYPKIRIVAFASYAREVKLNDVPFPAGGTDLGGGLEAAIRFRPRKTIVISDGLPDNEQYALEAAEQLTGAIDTIYCGPDSHPAIDFLRQLSRDTGGVQVTWDGYKTLSSAVRGLLGPAPDAKPDPDPKKHGPWNFFSNRRPTT